ncbi:hypothetical protein PUNSTDRAFT_111294 [Punctularia strigosozonata HHB-11173 SS5]|uniref:uncharacterized protein n=1 Tax=Punctularia strigosozonata (strain HHB-11173) TaxID=741275 RepID=UPI0004416D70|nr:uncharacterized protein PUNSTDRAFT_111294 [Punctularia strigosozonata HHB-11173 SS5]EIN12935.1 hypothetical protein PUNSTDRAFT_111294 [Punctularia strigosozonata HHB-11173 SS5]
MQSSYPRPYAKGDPWFEDGNIVLLTDLDPEPVAFKVHRGVLARHSDIFSDMMALPQPELSVFSDTVDDCTVVHMQDIPSELSILIKALYDGIEFGDGNLNDFLVIAAILRLSTKYFVGNLRTKAVRFLSSSWAHTLEGHDAFVERATSAPSVEGMSFPYVHPLHVLNLARETNVRILVPSALYFLSLYPLADILSGNHPKLVSSSPSAPSSTIGHGDFVACALLSQYRVDIILDFIRDFCNIRRCTSGAHPNLADTADAAIALTCSRAFASVASRLSRSWNVRTGPLYLIAQAMQEVSQRASICDKCKHQFRTDAKSRRREIWDGIPAVIGMPSWEELIAMDLPDRT